MVTGDMVKPGAVVIDVGMNRIEDRVRRRAATGSWATWTSRARASVASLITPGAGRRRADDDRDAAREHGARGGAERGAMKRGSRRPAPQAELLEPRAVPGGRAAARVRARARSWRARDVARACRRFRARRPRARSPWTLTQTAKDVIEGAFPPLWVRGEVSDFKAHRNGHWYFCLRDASAQIECVVWSRDQRGMPAPPDDGMQVVAFGRLTRLSRARRDAVHRRGASRRRATGSGARRSRSDARGSRRTDCSSPRASARSRAFRVAWRSITSPDGAALRDIIAVMRRRCPTVRDRRRAGEGAGRWRAGASSRARSTASRDGASADTVIIGRGGGAREDLWAFNDERVARALAACAMPTISAVGHEVDITLCDLVADHRAATPSAAAEAAVPVLAEARAEAAAMLLALREALVRQVQRRRDRVARAAHDLHVDVTRAAERRGARMSCDRGEAARPEPAGDARARLRGRARRIGRDAREHVGLRSGTRVRAPAARRQPFARPLARCTSRLARRTEQA